MRQKPFDTVTVPRVISASPSKVMLAPPMVVSLVRFEAARDTVMS